MRAEKRNENGKWELLGRIFTNDDFRENEPEKIDEDGFEWNSKLSIHPYNGRNYDLFGILADVRNGRGFAGIKTGEGFNPISDPKGIPADVSDGGKEYLDSYECDGHSHSYFTVKELLDYDWNQYTMHRGVISIGDYNNLKESKQSTPDSWSGMISGPGIVIVSEERADEIISNPDKEDTNRYYVNYHWTDLYRDSCSYFVDKIIPRLRDVGKPEDVRIIFFFDN